MGRLGKINHHQNATTMSQYKKLNESGGQQQEQHQQQEECAGSRESRNLFQAGFEGYLSFSCRHCGHLQIFQGSELDMILGKSLKMAFKPNGKRTTPDDATLSNNLKVDNEVSFKESLDGSSLGIPVDTGGPQVASESNSPTHLNQFKRHNEKPSLMKRLGKGFVLNMTSDEEGYPLVSDGSSSIPGSQSNISLLNSDPGSHEAATLRIDDLKPSKLLNFHRQPKTEEIEMEPVNRDANLRLAPWYQEGIPREIALEILSREPIGSFMVRKSTTKTGCFALSVRVPRSFQPKGIAHYLIMRTAKGFRIKGFTKEFPTLAALIAHHSVMPELLPCPLSLNRYHPVCVISDCRKDFADIQPQSASAAAGINC